MVTTEEWSIGEESGKVVADKWLHHLRFTLTEAPAAPSLLNKQSQPDAPSNSHVYLHSRVHSIHKHRLTSQSCFHHYHRPVHVTAVAKQPPGLAGTSTFHSPPKLLRLSNIPSLSRYNLQAAARRVRIVYLLGPDTTSSRPSHTRRPLRPLSSCRPNARPPPPLALARPSAWRQV
jgi:hypothetical protein